MSQNKLYENLKDRTLSRSRAVIEKMIKQDIRGLTLSPNAKNTLINKIYTHRSGKVKKISNNKVARALKFDPERYEKLNDAKKLLNRISIHTFPSKKAAIEKYLSTVNNKNIKNTLNKLQSYGLMNNKEIQEYIKNHNSRLYRSNIKRKRNSNTTIITNNRT